MALIVLASAISVAAGGVAQGATAYRIYLGSKEIHPDAAPFVSNNRLLVPLRAISEEMGAKVDWGNNTVTVHRDTDKLVLTIGSTTAMYNGIAIPMDVAPVLRSDRTFLPLRFVSEWLGLMVNYDGDTVRMYVYEPMSPDAMNAPRGNTNANLNNTGHAIIWRDRIYSAGLFAYELPSEEGVPLENIIEHGYFNIWQDQLYAVVGGNFVQLDRDGNILKTVAQGVRYCQIHDGWLYFVRESDRQLCRRPLEGGNVQPLDAYGSIEALMGQGVLEFVITDRHIYVNDGSSILRMELDGSNRQRLITVPVAEGRWYLNGLDYANGQLYVNVGGYTEQARICRLNNDGTGLRAVVQDGASDINVIGGWVYYSLLEGDVVSDMVPELVYSGTNIARVKLDGSGREVLTEAWGGRFNWCDSPTLMPDGSVYYRFYDPVNGGFWRKVTG